MVLKSQTTCERADTLVKKADDTNGNTEDIGGEVCAWGGVTLTVCVEGETCAMAGETKAIASLGFEERYHMIIQLILSQYHATVLHIHAKERRAPRPGYTRMG
jgi:hypothetical protein